MKNRNVIDAEAQAQEAVKLAPDNVDVRKLLARIYLAQTFVGTNTVKEKARAALKQLEESVRIDSNAKIGNVINRGLQRIQPLRGQARQRVLNRRNSSQR